MILVKDIITDKKLFFIAIMVALIANGVQYGYFVGAVVGVSIYHLLNKVFLRHYGKQ
jgi:cytosine/uracil/thiamine/allantoin permease